MTRPAQSSENLGPSDTRPRLGLRPNKPQCDAGMRIEPPPSPACASGTMPLATAAPLPPLEPPVERVVSHGLCAGPYASGSVVVINPNSGVFVLPTITKPAASSFANNVLVN